MKKNFLYVLALMTIMTFFTACNDDDDPMISPSDLNMTFGSGENAQLTLSYGNALLTGKQVKFETADSKTATLTLADVIPGETQTIINNIQLTEGQGEYTFSGSAVTTRTATIEYSGSVKKGALTLNLDVTMSDPNKWSKTYGLAELTLGDLDYGAAKPRPNVPIVSALYLSWSAPSANGMDLGKTNAVTYRGILGAILPQVLKSISLEPDGNICADYSSDAVEFDMSMINSLSPAKIAELVSKKTWQSSPKNLAFWFEKDGKLYVKLNISAIIAQAMSDKDQESKKETSTKSTGSTGSADQIRALLRSLGIDMNISDKTLITLLDWASNGIPLNVEVKEEHTYIYLNKEELDMIFASPVSSDEDPAFYEKSDFCQIIKAFSSSIPAEYVSMIGIVNQIPIQWPNTKEFSLGLDLIASVRDKAEQGNK